MPGDPADYLGDVNEWAWLDLWTADVPRTTDFYRAVGYDVSPVQLHELRRGSHLVTGGYARVGVMQKNDPGTSAVWLPYVRVADARLAVDAARAAGGKV